MLELNAENVDEIFLKCLFKDGEDTSNHVLAEAVMLKVGFHPQRLEENRSKIEELLSQLPDNFKEGKGGGWSFLNAIETAEGVQWAGHPDVDKLLALGIGVGKATILLPRELWSVFPGGLPYFGVKV
jgi:hypothetical protein